MKSIGGYEHLRIVLERQKKREEIGVPLGAKLLISIGELSIRKNHKIVVESLHSLSKDYWYIIIGKGELYDELNSLDHTGRLKLLGYRTDIVELLHCGDLFIFPSLQEGLPVALMEAMAAGLPVICSRIRGNVDLIDEKNTFDLGKIDQLMTCIEDINVEECTRNNLIKIKKYDILAISQMMHELYSLN